MPRRPLWTRCGLHYTPDMKTLLCYMWLNDRARRKTYAAAARLPGYADAWRADKENTINHYYCDRGKKGDNAHRVEIIAYLRGVHAAAAGPGGSPLPPAAVGQIPADLVYEGANIIAVPDLGSARAEDYSLFNTNTGEPVEQNDELLDLLQNELAARAAAGGNGDDEIPPADDDDDAGAEPPRVSTPTNAGANANAGASAAGDIGGFNTPPANASNSGSGRRGGPKSSGSSSLARSALSSIGNSIRNHRRKGAARNLWEHLRSPGSSSGRSSGTPLSRSTSTSASASASGWTMDDAGESPVGRDPPPDDQVPMVDEIPNGGGGGGLGGRARGNVHGDPMYDGDNEGDDDDDFEVEFAGNGVVGDDHRGRRRDGHRSLGTGTCTMRGTTSRPTSPKGGPRGGDLCDRSSPSPRGVGRDPSSIGLSPGYSEGEGGREDPPTWGDLVVGPGADLNVGAGLNAVAGASAGAGAGAVAVAGLGVGMGLGDGSGVGGQAGLDGFSMYETAAEEIEDGIEESEVKEDDISRDGGNGGVGDENVVASDISAGQSLSGAGAGAGANNDDVLAIIAQMQERIDTLGQENVRLKHQVNELEDIFDREQKLVATKDANARKQNEIFEERLAVCQDREAKIFNILESIRGKLGG